MPFWAGAMRAQQQSIPFRMLSKDERFQREDVPKADGTPIGGPGAGAPLNPVQRLLLAVCTCNAQALR
jgi:hypothetical protein